MTRALALINRLAEQDILLGIEAGELVIDAPRGALSEQDMQQIHDLLPELREWIPENPRPLPWRKEVARWSEQKRLRWGRRVNQLQDQGLAWYEAEARAVAEIKAHPGPQRRSTRGRVTVFQLVG
jgi:tubulysin polyketide synthase-like protein